MSSRIETIEPEIQVEYSPVMAPESGAIATQCSEWCFLFGLGGGNAVCQLENGHGGEHKLVVTSVSPEAVFNVGWTTETTGEIAVTGNPVIIETQEKEETIVNEVIETVETEAVEEAPEVAKVAEAPEATEVAEAPAANQRAVPIGPVPTSWNISKGQTQEGANLVIIQVQTPEGDKYFFVAPSVALQLGEALIKLGTE